MDFKSLVKEQAREIDDALKSQEDLNKSQGWGTAQKTFAQVKNRNYLIREPIITEL